VLDCAHGAMSDLAPLAFGRAGAEVVVLHAEPDGARINEGCGTLHPQDLAAQVVVAGADLGVAFDGDGDRVFLVDADGVVRDGDYLKYVLAADLGTRGRLDPPLVVGTVMSNLGLELALRALGLELVRSAVGDRHVRDQMAATGARLGGEQSGHLVLADLGLGDGLYVALRLGQILRRSGRTLAELCAPLSKVPQTLVNVPVLPGTAWGDTPAFRRALAEWEARLGQRGRVLIRASGTEPVVRVMIEALDEDLAHAAAADLAHLLTREGGYGELPPDDEA